MVTDSQRRGFRSSPGLQGGFGRNAVPLLGLSQSQQLAKQEFARARRYGYPLTIGTCRIDRIDRLADLYGLESKRLLMDQLARMFHARSRSTDIVGRMGEDRLLWVLPHTDLEGARLAADRIRRAIEEIELESGTRQLSVTLSVGLACYVKRNTLFFDSILLQAEQALHRAQDAGGNLVEWHPLPVRERMEGEAIRDMIDESEGEATPSRRAGEADGEPAPRASEDWEADARATDGPDVDPPEADDGIEAPRE